MKRLAPTAAAKTPLDLTADEAKLQGCALFIMLASLYVPTVAEGVFVNQHVDDILKGHDTSDVKPYLPTGYNVDAGSLTPLYATAFSNIHEWVKGMSDSERQNLNLSLAIARRALNDFVNAALKKQIDYPEGNPDNCLGQITGENLAHYGVLTPKA